MRTMTMMPMKPRRTGRKMNAMPEKREMMLRRAGNHNAHMITPHGKLRSGRKGRKG